VRALAAQSYPAERCELVVVLDGSTDASAGMLRSLDTPFGIEVVEQPGSGVGPARNRGVQAARHPVVVFLDDDIVPEPQFLAEHAAAHSASRRGCLVLGRCPAALERSDLWSFAIRGWWLDHFRRKEDPAHQWTYFDTTDGIASIGRDTFLDSGGFDEAFRERRQDWEWGIRLLARGVPFVYNPRAAGLHHLDTTLATAVANRRKEARNDVLLAQRHPDVAGRIYLARYFTPGGPRLEGSRALPFGRAGAAMPAVRVGLAAARALEAADRRAEWGRLVRRLMEHVYLLGVADALGGIDRVRELMAPVAGGELDVDVPLELASAGGLHMPPEAGSPYVVLTRDGRKLARFAAVESDSQFDWGSLGDRAVQAALGEYGRAEGLTGGHSGAAEASR
jgi:GT2 family glycosyltransferase